jgi:predicted alpha/beta-hydrolase family hydrolase
VKRPSELTIPIGAGAHTSARLYPVDDAGVGAVLLLAHGAGAGQSSPFMVEFASSVSASGIHVVTFNFPYMDQRRRAPDRGPVLESAYRAVVSHVRELDLPDALFIGGKSMGGRIATQIAAADRDLPVRGLVLLGYPLHPPGQADKRRDAHFPSIRRPMLFVQGDRDAFGTPDELAPALTGISPAPTVHVVRGGDHSFKLPRKNPADQATLHRNIQQTIVEWISRTAPSGSAGSS